jgi:hypothetical protein
LARTAALSALAAVACLVFGVPNASKLQADAPARDNTPASTAGALPILVSFDLMDSKTAASRYGARISRDYLIVRATVTNRLGEAEQGTSILAYGDGIYARIVVEKRLAAGGTKGPSEDEMHWKRASPVNYAGAVLPDIAGSAVSKPPAGPSDQDASAPDSFRVQPCSFAEIVAMACQSHHNAPTRDQIRHIVLETMEPVEEVAFGGHITRILFFARQMPRRPENGYVFRVSEIYTGYFNTMVPVVENRSAQAREAP